MAIEHAAITRAQEKMEKTIAVLKNELVNLSLIHN